MSPAPVLPYLVFTGGILGLTAVIRFFAGGATPTRRGAYGQTALWLVVTAAFAGFLAATRSGHDALLFVTGYLVEEALSVDNLFVFLLIFEQFKVPAAAQTRVLSWGLTGALVMRALFIALGAALIERFSVILMPLGLLLCAMGLKLLFTKGHAETADVEKTPVSKKLTSLQKWLPFPVTDSLVGDKFWVRQQGRTYLTPLALVLLLIELGDIMFAVDSVPAIFAVTRDPFLIFTSNVLAIVGLRALFFVLTDLVRNLRYLKVGLSFILMFVGAKLACHSFFEISALVSLVAVVTILTVTVLVSWLRGPKIQKIPSNE